MKSVSSLYDLTDLIGSVQSLVEKIYQPQNDEIYPLQNGDLN